MGNDLSTAGKLGQDAFGAGQGLAAGGVLGGIVGLTAGEVSDPLGMGAKDLVEGDTTGAFRQLKVAGYLAEQTGKATLGVVQGLAGIPTGNFNFREFTGSVENLYDATVGHSQDISDILNPPTASQIAARQAAKVDQINANNLKGAIPIGNIVKSNYEGNNRGQVMPSDIQKISNPSVKMAVASSRGDARNALQAVGNQYNARMAQSAQPVAGVGSSATNNSGGEKGITTSNDVDNSGIEKQSAAPVGNTSSDPSNAPSNQ